MQKIKKMTKIRTIAMVLALMAMPSAAIAAGNARFEFGEKPDV